MKRELSLSARSVFLFAGGLLIVGAVAVGGLAIKAAANIERTDPNAAVAQETARRADMAATALSERMQVIGGLLEGLAQKGGGRSNAAVMKSSSKLFDRTAGLEQLAAYSLDGKTLWVSRPAERGRIRVPESKDFVLRHLSRPELKLRIASPFQPTKRDGWWTPVTYYAQGKTAASSAVLVAFVRSEALQPMLASAGQVAALFTDSGELAAAEPAANAPLGASFVDAPGFRKIEDQTAAAGAYIGEPEIGPSPPRIVGYSKLACCGAVVTTIAPVAPPPPIDTRPVGQWLALAAAGLMIAMGFAIVSKRIFSATPDPWQEFGEGRI